MKRLSLALLAAALWAPGPSSALELQTADGASITVRTRTQFEVSVDDPSRFGLVSSIPELSLNFPLTPWQKVGDLPRSAQPLGFVQFELDKIELRYTNGALNDYNAPPGSGSFGFGFNDPAQSKKTGYFGPVYMPNMRSGIVWGDWLLQLAAAGGQNFNNPWNREYARSYERLSADWAYLDTRVQFRRASVETYLQDRTKEDNYWSYDTAAGPFDSLTNDFSTGSLVALEYGTKTLAARWKVNTRYSLANLPQGQTNGVGLGTDVSFVPTKGVTSTSSVVGRFHYVGDPTPDLAGAGTKLAVEVPFPGLKGLTLAPVLGYDLSLGLSGTKVLSQEGSAAVTIGWAGSSGWAYDYLRDRSGAVWAGTSLAYKVYQADARAGGWSQEVLFTLFEDPGDEGLVKGLGTELVLEGHDVASPSRWATVSAYVDGTLKAGKGQLVPWTRVFYDWNDKPKNQLSAELGLKLEKFIPKATFGLTWQSLDLVPGTPTPGWGTVKLSADLSL